MPDLRTCKHCSGTGYAPELLPYVGANGGRVWAHQRCHNEALAASIAAQGPLKFPVHHENGDGC